MKLQTLDSEMVAAAGPAFRGADCAPALAVALLAAWERRAA